MHKKILTSLVLCTSAFFYNESLAADSVKLHITSVSLGLNQVLLQNTSTTPLYSSFSCTYDNHLTSSPISIGGMPVPSIPLAPNSDVIFMPFFYAPSVFYQAVNDLVAQKTTQNAVLSCCYAFTNSAGGGTCNSANTGETDITFSTILSNNGIQPPSSQVTISSNQSPWVVSCQDTINGGNGVSLPANMPYAKQTCPAANPTTPIGDSYNITFSNA